MSEQHTTRRLATFLKAYKAFLKKFQLQKLRKQNKPKQAIQN